MNWFSDRCDLREQVPQLIRLKVVWSAGYSGLSSLAVVAFGMVSLAVLQGSR